MTVSLGAKQTRGRHHRFENALVGGASAQIAAQREPSLILGRLWTAIEEHLRTHDLTRRAEAALISAVLDECLLDWMQLVVRGQPLDRQHVAGGGLERERRARVHVPAIEHDRARATLQAIAAHLRARELQILTQEL